MKKNMKVYKVAVAEICQAFVKAENEKEAIKKAEDFDFFESTLHQIESIGGNAGTCVHIEESSEEEKDKFLESI